MPNPSELTRQDPDPKTYSTREAIAMMLKGYEMVPVGTIVSIRWLCNEEVGGSFVDSQGHNRSIYTSPNVMWTIHSYPQQFDGTEAVRLAKETGRWIKHVGNRQFHIRWDQAKLEFITDDGRCYPWDYTDTEAMWELHDEPQPPESAKAEQICGTCRYHHHDHCRIAAKDGVTMISRQCVVGQLTKTASTDTCAEWREKAS